jgi:hypothetical protein
MNLSAMISLAIERKTGNKEFALFSECGGDDKGKWQAWMGNTSIYCQLGESEAEIVGIGDTPEAAVLDLLKKMDAGQ